MHIERLTLRNFRCFGNEAVTVSFGAGTNALVGDNGSGKTTTLEALKRLFSAVPQERQMRKADVHFGPGEDSSSVDSRELVIDVVFGFDSDGALPTVFNDLFFDSENQSLKVRIVLECEYKKSMSFEDDMEVKLYSVRTLQPVPFGPDDERKTPIRGRPTQYAELVYIPAHRDARGVTQFALKHVLQRLERSADWGEETRKKSQEFAQELEQNLNDTLAIKSITKDLGDFWRSLHDGHYDAAPTLSVVATEFEKLIRELTLRFSKSPGGGQRQLEELSEGQMSLLYFALSATLHKLSWDMQNADGQQLKGFKALDFNVPPLTIFALEEPENHLSPFYLPRLMALLEKLHQTGASQAIVTSHATSILARVSPRKVLFFRNHRETLVSSVNPIPLPEKGSEEDKFVQQVLLANPEIYFARLVIIGEGDTERIVIPRVAEALGLSMDPSFVAYVSIGGRHAQHLWKLLNGLKIPHITLLDFDLGRYGGGAGRIRNAVQWMKDAGFGFPVGLDIPDNEALDAASYDGWVKWLRSSDIFYSSPVDLDMMMLQAFPDAYKPEKAYDAGKADNAKIAKKVFGDSGKGNADLQRIGLNISAEALYAYKALFKSDSKPGSHLVAFGRMDDGAIAQKCPEPLVALVERAKELLLPPDPICEGKQ